MTTPHRNLRLLNILTFLYTFRTFEGVWVVYFAMVTGSYATAMSMFALMHVTSSSMEVPTGLLSDRIGRKQTLVLYCLFGVASTALFYIAESTFLVVIGSILVGLSMSFGSGTMSAFVYENTQVLGKTEQYKKYEGFRRALTKYSIGVAGIIGTVVIYFFDIRTALLVTLVAMTGSIVRALFLRDLPSKSATRTSLYQDMRTALRQFKRDVRLRDFSIGRMFARGVGNAEYRLRSLFLSSLMPEWLVNLVMVVAGFFVGMCMHASHYIVERFGLKNALIHLEIVNRVVVTSCAYVSTMVSGIVLSVSNAISHGVSDVASEHVLQNQYTNEQRATMGSLVSLGGSVIYIIVATSAGVLADQIGLLYTMLAVQPFLLVGTYFYWRGLR